VKKCHTTIDNGGRAAARTAAIACAATGNGCALRRAGGSRGGAAGVGNRATSCRRIAALEQALRGDVDAGPVRARPHGARLKRPYVFLF